MEAKRDLQDDVVEGTGSRPADHAHAIDHLDAAGYERDPDYVRTRLARALRELDAAKERVERDARAVHDETRRRLVSELLPVLDNLDRAIVAADSNGNAASVIDGVRLVQRQLETVLVGYGLVRFDAVGAVFDPLIHDAQNMIMVDDPDQDRRVIAQLVAGYRFGDQLLRAAKVVVGKHVRRV